MFSDGTHDQQVIFLTCHIINNVLYKLLNEDQLNNLLISRKLPNLFLGMFLRMQQEKPLCSVTLMSLMHSYGFFTLMHNEPF